MKNIPTKILLLSVLLITIGVYFELRNIRETEKRISSNIAEGQSPSEAMTSCKKWCFLGVKILTNTNSSAQVILGLDYQYGIYAQKDTIKAIAKYRQAARNNNDTAQLLLGRMYDTYNYDPIFKTRIDEKDFKEYLMDETGNKIFALDDMEAIGWYVKSANQGNVAAQLLLGKLYEADQKYEDNYINIAAQWYEKASNNGNAIAQNILGTFYISGIGVVKNADKGIDLLKRAATQGNIDACYELGLAYNGGFADENGDPIMKNPTDAAFWYRRAADKGNELAQRELGEMYMNGVGVPRDYNEAYRLLNQAAAKDAPGAGSLRDRLEPFVLSNHK